ncbi:MAG: hypothetical protein KDH96_03625 [Candidatus Riesia sp.]|nr:hypothetical protein [Candidatus Riesia sp.]
MKIQTHKNPDDSYIAWIEGEDHIIGHGTSEINAIEQMIKSKDLLILSLGFIFGNFLTQMIQLLIERNERGY